MKLKLKMPRESSKKQRFIFVIDAFTKGGAQRNIQLVLPELISLGHRVDLVLLQNSSHELDLASLIDNGVHVHRIRASKMFDLLGFIRYVKVVGTTPALVVANLYWSQIWSSLLRVIRPNVKVAWVEHNTYVNRSEMQWKIYKTLSLGSSVILAVSYEIKDFIALRTRCTTRVINNAALPLFQRKNYSVKSPVFLLVGRLVEQKNPSLALDAFVFAIESKFIPTDSKLLILGTGPLEENLKLSMSNSSHKLKVEFRGYLDSHEVSRIMSESNVLMMTSFHEGSPLVRLEALAHGMTIVTTKTAGIKGILTVPDSQKLLPGVYVSESNINSVAKVLSDSINQQNWTEQAVNLRFNSSLKFHPTKVAQAYLELLEF